MNRNKSLVTFGAAAILAVIAFSQSFAQTSVTAFKKGSPEAIAQLSAQAQAQTSVATPAKGDRGAKRLELLQQRLSLTADQTAKIKAIIQNSREQMKKNREQAAGADKEAAKKARQEAIKNIDAQIQEVLTVEQRTKYTSLKAEMKARMEEGKNRDERDHDKEND